MAPPIIRGTWEAIMQSRTTGLLLLGAMARTATAHTVQFLPLANATD
jgi:hypothetical protein